MSQIMSFNDTMISNPEPEPVFVSKEGKSNFIKAIICISVDFLTTIFLIFIQYGLFQIFEEKLQTNYIVIIGTIAFAFFAFIISFIISHVTILVIISKFSYIIIGSLYYGYKVILMIIYLIENEDGISNLALVFFIIILGTIVPRAFAFYNLESLEKVCKKVDESKRILNHQKFFEKLGKKIDYGIGNSRWSNALAIERTSNVNSSIDKKT